MSMDTTIFYHDPNGNARGLFIGHDYRKVADALRNEFGRDRGRIVEWIEDQGRGEYDTHVRKDHGDNLLNEKDIRRSLAEEFLYVDGEGVIRDVTRRLDKEL